MHLEQGRPFASGQATTEALRNSVLLDVKMEGQDEAKLPM